MNAIINELSKEFPAVQFEVIGSYFEPMNEDAFYPYGHPRPVLKMNSTGYVKITCPFVGRGNDIVVTENIDAIKRLANWWQLRAFKKGWVQ